MSRATSIAGLLFGMAALGAGGFWLGGSLVPGPDARIRSETRLVPGETLPSVSLLTELGETVASTRFVGDAPVTFLFLDLQCPPCVRAIDQWGEAVASGNAPTGSIVGVASQSPAEIAAYREQHGVVFPILQDPAAVFREKFSIHHTPYEITVDAAGVIVASGPTVLMAS